MTEHDAERREGEALKLLKAELQRAFAAPDESYAPLDADAVISGGRGPTR